MSSPDWYIELENSLKKHFDENKKINNLSGEQFLRNYLLENPLQNYTEEDDDQIVDDHLDPIQTYLSTLDWVTVDDDSCRWLRASVQPQVQIDTPPESKSLCDKSRLDELLNKATSLEVDELEWAKQELLIERCDYDNIEVLRYKLAKEICKHENYTQDDKAEAWYLAANISSSSQKSLECLEFASALKASQYKFEEAAIYLEEAVYELDPSLHLEIDRSWLTNLCNAVKRRLCLTFQKENIETHEQSLRVVRKCQVFYEQAGNRHKSSDLFVLEADIDKRRKKFASQLIVFLYWFFAKYGESPIRVLISSCVIILTWAIIYSCMGVSYNLGDGGGEIDKLITNIYFSIVTFTTLGYGDFSPPVEGRIIASIQAMLGLFMTSLFLVTFVRRHSR